MRSKAVPPTGAVRITANFERNLESIRAFLEEAAAPQVFAALLDELFDKVIPNLERLPALGFDFLARTPQSHEGLLRLKSLKERLGGHTQLREIVVGDYLVLYAERAGTLYFLAIKHHRQLSFDLKSHWVR